MLARRRTFLAWAACRGDRPGRPADRGHGALLEHSEELLAQARDSSIGDGSAACGERRLATRGCRCGAHRARRRRSTRLLSGLVDTAARQHGLRLSFAMPLTTAPAPAHLDATNRSAWRIARLHAIPNGGLTWKRWTVSCRGCGGPGPMPAVACKPLVWASTAASRPAESTRASACCSGTGMPARAG